MSLKTYKILLLLLISINCYSQDSTVIYMPDSTTYSWVEYEDSSYNYLDGELVYKEVVSVDTTFAYSKESDFWVYLWKSVKYHGVATMKLDVIDCDIVVFSDHQTIGIRSGSIVNKVKIYDIKGKLLVNKDIRLNEVNLNVNYEGIVIINIFTDENKFIRKLLLH